MIVLYARVSTTDQTTAPQVTQAGGLGFKVGKGVADEGGSGVSTKLSERDKANASPRRNSRCH
jgi:putative DNA-invertase from lambdoid prophage Rac